MLISTVFMWVAIAAGFVVSLAAGAGPLARGRSKAPPRFNPGYRKTPPAWRAGKYQDAIASYTQSQKEPQALMRISECQGSLKQHDAAIQTLGGVLNFFKSSAPEAQYRISTHYAAKGDKEAAIRTLKAICKTHLNTSWAGRAHQDLSLTYGIDVTLGGAAAAKPEAQ